MAEYRQYIDCLVQSFTDKLQVEATLSQRFPGANITYEVFACYFLKKIESGFRNYKIQAFKNIIWIHDECLEVTPLIVSRATSKIGIEMFQYVYRKSTEGRSK